MNPDVIERLEEPVDKLLAERKELQHGHRSLSEERDRLLADRSRVQDELNGLLAKLDELEGKRP